MIRGTVRRTHKASVKLRINENNNIALCRFEKYGVVHAPTAIHFSRHEDDTYQSCRTIEGPRLHVVVFGISFLVLDPYIATQKVHSSCCSSTVVVAVAAVRLLLLLSEFGSTQPTQDFPRRVRPTVILYTSMRSLLLSSLFFFWESRAESLSGGVIHSQRDVLSQVYSATGGEEWKNHGNWSSPTANECDFWGVECFADPQDTQLYGHVKSLDLSDNALQGTLPDAVWELPFLQTLVLRGNHDVHVSFGGLEGAPSRDYLTTVSVSECVLDDGLAGIEQATQLQELHITNCNLSGPFPPQILQLPNLSSLMANYNHWTGPLPTQIGSLWHLQHLFLYQNDLQGPLPTQLGHLVNLQTLTLALNQFTGNLPTQLEQMTSLQILSLQQQEQYDNNNAPALLFTGPLPALAHAPDLRQVYLQNNALTGRIPDNFLQSTPSDAPLHLDLSHNLLTGSLPQSLLQKPHVNLLGADNHLTLNPAFCPSTWMRGQVGQVNNSCDAVLCPPGTYSPHQGRSVPQQPCLACNATTTTFWGSTTCGTVTTATTVLAQLYERLQGRYWKRADGWSAATTTNNNNPCTTDYFGVECDQASGQITGLRLAHNGLTGDLPVDLLAAFSQLTYLDLSGNDVQLDLAALALPNLQVLNLAQTGMSSWNGVGALSKSSKLRVLDLSSNNLHGNLPVDLYSLVSLQELDISHNQITGPLSTQIGQLVRLQRFQCFGNQLSGSLPTQLGALVELQQFLAAENRFSGPLPVALNNLVELETISLHQTASDAALTGTLLSFRELEQLTSLQLDGNALTGDLPGDFLENTRRGDDRIEIYLADNKFSGVVPSQWTSRFRQLMLDLTGNEIRGFGSHSFCTQNDWMDQAVTKFACDAILCPAGTYNALGRRTTAAMPCETCDEASFYGSKTCGSDAGDDDSTLALLRRLFASTNGNTWKRNDGWGTSSDYCSFFGVVCNAAGDVVKIDLAQNLLTGTPTTDIYKLSSLQELNLETNEISLAFDGIEQATSLSTLILSGTGLEAVAGIEKAQSLMELHLTDNKLKAFPSEILALTGLRKLFLNFNHIAGPIPAEISTLSNLEALYLFHNRLTGQLPAALGSLISLSALALSENNFSGTLPEQLNDLTNLELLAIQREGGTDKTQPGNVGVNQGRSQDEGPGIGGALLSFDRMPKIRRLFLGTNRLSGSIPANFLDGIDDKNQEIEVDLISNVLDGTIPASLARFENLSLYLADNKITSIPDGVCGQENWMNGLVGTYRCDAILCPPGTWSSYGRQADISSRCAACPQGSGAAFYGSFSCLDSKQQAEVSERVILEDFFGATKGKHWRFNDNWMDPDLSVCEFHGIECTSDGHVESIVLPQNSLVGEIPTSIFRLPYIAQVNLAMNDIKISFEGVSGASKLEFLNLDSTNLQSLDGLQNAPSLKALQVVDNDFPPGTFPTEILASSGLRFLHLSGNLVGGELPAELSNLSNLETFVCSRCGLRTGLGPAVSSLSSLKVLKLDGNGFSEALPEGLEELTSLEVLDLSNQLYGGGGLQGNLTSFEGLVSLSEVRLQKNRLEGQIPDALLASTSASRTVVVDLRSNGLTGPVPVSLKKFPDLFLYLADNRIDELSSELCDLSWNGATGQESCDFIACPVGYFNGLGRATIELPCEACPIVSDAPFLGSTSCGLDLERDILNELFIDLGGNEWDNSDGWTLGTDVCSFHGVTCHDSELREGLVKAIDLSGNNLAGTVSERIWFLTHLEELDLSNNELEIAFDKIGDATTLRTLDVSRTNVRSVSGIHQARSLSELHLTSCGIGGSFPEELFGLTQMEKLFLSHNRFTGTLPEDIYYMNSLQELYISSNELEGEIPDQIASLLFVRVLSLGENKFSGTIPSLLSSLPFLEVLSLQQRPQPPVEPSLFAIIEAGLVGDLPSFSGLSRLRELYLGNNFLGGTIPVDFLAGLQNKAAPVLVDLTNNQVHGGIPTSLVQLDDLRLLLSGNLIDEVPAEICDTHSWMNGLLASGCDFLLCDKGTYNQYGRRVESEDCLPCEYFGSSPFFGSTSCGPELPWGSSERDVLVEFYASTGGENWFESGGWLTADPICDWHGVQCEMDDLGQETVTGITLSSNNLIGYPSFVLHLPSLKSLDLSENLVTMSFRNIAEAESLEELHLSATKTTSLQGIGGAANLKVLRLDDNDFIGQSLPEELFSLESLRELHVSRCGFERTIPSQIGKLTALESFTAVDNVLSGLIPESIGRLEKLEILHLSDNNLFGKLPQAIENLVSLETLAIDARKRSTAGISGPLPSFMAVPKLSHIDLGSNSLTGTIPSSFLAGLADPTQVVTVLLDSNLLSGVIPSVLGTRLRRLNLDLADNEISGVGEGLCDMEEWSDGDVGRYSCERSSLRARFFQRHRAPVELGSLHAVPWKRGFGVFR